MPSGSITAQEGSGVLQERAAEDARGLGSGSANWQITLVLLSATSRESIRILKEPVDRVRDLHTAGQLRNCTIHLCSICSVAVISYRFPRPVKNLECRKARPRMRTFCLVKHTALTGPAQQCQSRALYGGAEWDLQNLEPSYEGV